MTKDLWINLPVKDVKKSREFFTKIGFTQNTRFPETDKMSSLFVGTKSFVIMRCAESVFHGFTNNNIADTKNATEVLFSFDAESREEVDELEEKVKTAGGKVWAAPGESGLDVRIWFF